ncbi:hypothetical protein [Kocuria rosea]|uniref:hypothetical protein n=1 Tax=Kocuria rosea TaxID=1275 RepID=UPI0010A4E9E5|nr:hypothetical protein [Kocuria rosea]MEB2528384.1 hypothetical protein [Kocuria rosea]MEB2617885.1 hypothetical protein [Kocuria rosea]THE19087.1 hypothetical protein E1J17_02865 [Kocuria rosea]
MKEYTPPKLFGQRVALNMRVKPAQHRRVAERAAALGLSQADYVGALVDRDYGLPNQIDDRQNQDKDQLPLDH